MTSPISVFSAARYICNKADWRLTNLQLQKIIYLAHMLYAGKQDGARLIRQDFEAWDRGPVVPELYHKIKIFGAKPIEDIFLLAPPINEGPEKDVLDEACEALLRKSPSELVAITHQSHGAWSKSRSKKNGFMSKGLAWSSV